MGTNFGAWGNMPTHELESKFCEGFYRVENLGAKLLEGAI